MVSITPFRLTCYLSVAPLIGVSSRRIYLYVPFYPKDLQNDQKSGHPLIILKLRMYYQEIVRHYTQLCETIILKDFKDGGNILLTTC